MVHGGRWAVVDVSPTEVRLTRGPDTIRVLLDHTTRTVHCVAGPHLDHIARDVATVLQSPVLHAAQVKHAGRV